MRVLNRVWAWIRVEWHSHPHVTRWRLLAVYFVVFTAVMGNLVLDNRNATENNRKLIILVAKNTAEIQKERTDSILRNCTDSNKRHHDTLKVLKKLLDKNPQPAAQKIAVYKSTKYIINALVPKQNCKKLIARSVSP